MRYMDDYWVYPWPVEIINEASDWAWFGPVLAFVSSALLFAGGLYGVYKTNAAAAKRLQQELGAAQAKHDAEMTAATTRHEEQLAAMRDEGRAERAAQRNDRFREEVANLLGERWATENAAYNLAENADEYYKGLKNPTTLENAITAAELLAVRDQDTPQIDKAEHLAIRAALLTNDPVISEVLYEIRTAAQGWKDLVDSDQIATFMDIRNLLEDAFEKLEVLTRQLVTSDGAA